MGAIVKKLISNAAYGIFHCLTYCFAHITASFELDCSIFQFLGDMCDRRRFGQANSVIHFLSCFRDNSYRLIRITFNVRNSDGSSPRASTTQLESSKYKCSGSNFSQLNSTRECIDSTQLELECLAR